MKSRLRSFCLHSLTIAWSYLLAAIGVAMTLIDNIGEALGDPTLRDQLSAAVGDAKITGRILLGISVITIMARLRSLRKAI
jgi:hypothetical protein